MEITKTATRGQDNLILKGCERSKSKQCNPHVARRDQVVSMNTE